MIYQGLRQVSPPSEQPYQEGHSMDLEVNQRLAFQTLKESFSQEPILAV
jgi:hypothetical protein